LNEKLRVGYRGEKGEPNLGRKKKRKNCLNPKNISSTVGRKKKIVISPGGGPLSSPKKYE